MTHTAAISDIILRNLKILRSRAMKLKLEENDKENSPDIAVKNIPLLEDPSYEGGND